MNVIQTYNTLVGISIIGMQILVVFCILTLIFRQSFHQSNSSTNEQASFFTRCSQFFGRHEIMFAWIIALVSMIGSLIYSEVIGFPPCLLCWWQRVFIYPQVFILLIGIIRKDRMVAWYGIVLAFFGSIIALYHYLIEHAILDPLATCVAQGSVPCTAIYVNQFGYITIPMMSLTACVLIFVLLVHVLLTHKK
jgi:disulfide bond formation protein DsbB